MLSYTVVLIKVESFSLHHLGAHILKRVRKTIIETKLKGIIGILPYICDTFDRSRSRGRTTLSQLLPSKICIIKLERGGFVITPQGQFTYTGALSCDSSESTYMHGESTPSSHNYLRLRTYI
jgi:hypothetical protein